jgi:hypothetical protein
MVELLGEIRESISHHTADFILLQDVEPAFPGFDFADKALLYSESFGNVLLGFTRTLIHNKSCGTKIFNLIG